MKKKQRIVKGDRVVIVGSDHPWKNHIGIFQGWERLGISNDRYIGSILLENIHHKAGIFDPDDMMLVED